MDLQWILIAIPWLFLIVLSTIVYVRPFQPPNQTQHHSSMPFSVTGRRVSKRLITLAHLASISYCESRLSTPQSASIKPILMDNHVEFDRVRIIEDGSRQVTVVGNGISCKSMFHVQQTYANNSIWILKPANTRLFTDNCLVIYRGTHVLTDLVADSSLAASVSGINDEPLRKLLDKAFSLLVDVVLKEMHISASDSICFVGHSLGATLADAMMHRLAHRQYRSVRAVVFDSPRLPKWFRSDYELSRADGNGLSQRVPTSLPTGLAGHRRYVVPSQSFKATFRNNDCVRGLKIVHVT